MTTFTYDFLSLTSFNEDVDIWLDGYKTRKLFTRTDYNKIKDILENPEKKIESTNYRYWVRKNFVLQKIGFNNVVMKISSNRSKKDNDAFTSKGRTLPSVL